jgi:hypothetical protein
MLWLTENLDFILEIFILLPDMQFSDTEKAFFFFGIFDLDMQFNNTGAKIHSLTHTILLFVRIVI